MKKQISERSRLRMGACDFWYSLSKVSIRRTNTRGTNSAQKQFLSPRALRFNEPVAAYQPYVIMKVIAFPPGYFSLKPRAQGQLFQDEPLSDSSRCTWFPHVHLSCCFPVQPRDEILTKVRNQGAAFAGESGDF